MRVQWPALTRAFRRIRTMVETLDHIEDMLDNIKEDINDLSRMVSDQQRIIEHQQKTIEHQSRLIASAIHTEKEIAKRMNDLDQAFDELTKQVEANTSAEQGAVVLIGQLADLIHANAGDPAKVRAFAVKLKAAADPLAAALVANTPAPNAPPA